MCGRSSFKDPLRSLGHGNGAKDFEVETVHRKPVYNTVALEEGLMPILSKLIEMTRLLEQCFSDSGGADPETCSRLAEEVREQSRILTKALVSMQVGERVMDSLIRLPIRFERVGHMLENLLDCYLTKRRTEITFTDKARREQEQMFAVLLDIVTNFRDTLQNPSREGLLAVLFQGKRLEEMVQQFARSHWERVKSGACLAEASSMWCEILDSAKWANEYLMEGASTLLEIGEMSHQAPPGVGEVLRDAQKRYCSQIGRLCPSSGGSSDGQPGSARDGL
jgi:Na+/phosphate symporter